MFTVAAFVTGNIPDLLFSLPALHYYGACVTLRQQVGHAASLSALQQQHLAMKAPYQYSVHAQLTRLCQWTACVHCKMYLLARGAA